MTQRELTMIGLSGLVVAALIGWATQGPVGDGSDAARSRDGAGSGSTTLERSEGLPEIRRLIQHMLGR